MEPTSANHSVAEAVAKIIEEDIPARSPRNERTDLSSMQEPLAAGARLMDRQTLGQSGGEHESGTNRRRVRAAVAGPCGKR
jgi:hypothetical protein